MDKAIQSLRLAQLGSELSQAYLSQAIEELAFAVKKLEDCLDLRESAGDGEIYI